MAQWPFRTAGINVSCPMAPAFAKVACAQHVWGSSGVGTAGHLGTPARPCNEGPNGDRL
jgi:hypothetical protein